MNNDFNTIFRSQQIYQKYSEWYNSVRCGNLTSSLSGAELTLVIIMMNIYVVLIDIPNYLNTFLVLVMVHHGMVRFRTLTSHSG